MSSEDNKATQVAEFQALFFRAYQLFMHDQSRPLLEIFSNLAFGGLPPSTGDAKTDTPEVVDERPAGEAVEEEVVEAEAPKEEVKEQTTPARPTSSRVAPGGTSSIRFGDNNIPAIRSSTRVRQPAGGKSSIQLGGPVDVPTVRTSVRVAPGGSSNLQLGGPHLEKDNTRPKKKTEIMDIKQAPLPTPREMAQTEQKSNIFDSTPMAQATPETDPNIDEQFVRAVQKFDKQKLAYMEFVGDSSGKLATKESFLAGGKRLGIQFTEEYVQGIFDAYDTKKTGAIGFSAFVRFISKITP